VAVDVDVRDAQDAPPPPRRRIPRGLLLALGALAASWLVPVLTHALAIDWVLPILLWVAVAALLRAGRTVLDRLVFALVLLLGAVPVAGLVISYWPWGVQPVPVAGFGFTGLVAIAALLRRRPALPTAWRPADLVTLGLSALSFGAVFWPYRHADKTERFALIAAGGDYANHFELYDAIRRIGGYPFLHPGRAGAQLWDLLVSYPQGLHMTAAVLGSFVRSDGTDAPSALPELDTFVWFEPATFVFMCVAIVWALRWIAGPSLRPWLALPVGVLGISYVVFGDLLTLLWLGYWAEVAGLGEFAILVAVLVRPLPRMREQAVLVAALMVAICFTYFFLLPVVVVVILAWLWTYRRRLVGYRLFVLGTGLVAAALGAIMVYVNAAAISPTAHLTSGGTILHPAKRTLFTMTFLAFALAAGAARRSRVWRVYLVAQLASIALIIGIAAYQEAIWGVIQYYFYKAEHALMVVDVIGLGAAAPLLSRLVGRVGRADLRGRRVVPALMRAAVPSAALCLAAVAALGPFLSDSFARQYLHGKQAWHWPVTVALRVAAVVPAGQGDVIVVWPGPNKGEPPHATHWSNVLLRDHGHGYLAANYVYQKAYFEELFAGTPYPVQVVTDNPDVVAQVKQILDRHPEYRSRVHIVNVPIPTTGP
jgi:hypothetical protein